jgi:hypothetical protein
VCCAFDDSRLLSPCFVAIQDLPHSAPCVRIFGSVAWYLVFLRHEIHRQNPNYIYNNNNVEVVNMLPMKRVPFNHLANTFRVRVLLQDSIHTCIEEQVAMFIHVVGHNHRFQVIHNTQRRSNGTIHQYINQVLYVIGELGGEMIKPLYGQNPTNIQDRYCWFSYFKVSNSSLYFLIT